MNTNRQFKVIVSIIVTLMIVILGLNISKAQRFDDNSLLVDGIYCIQGGVAINENSRYVTVKKPDGNGGTISESVLAYVVNNYTAGDMRTITSAHNASVNQRKMAYVLWTDRSGHKDYGGAQTYIWVEKSIASSGLGVSVTAVGKGNTPQGNQMRAKVDNYINVEATDASIKKSSNVAKTVKSENYKVGPFSVDYNGTITKVQIKYKDEDELVDVKASSIIQNDKKLNNISDLAKNTYFYIMNTSEKEVESVSISVHKEHPIYSVTFRPWICKGDTYTGIAAVGWTVQHIQDAPKDKQDLIECGSYGQDVCKTDATYTFNVKVYKGKIKLTKYGTWNGENKPLPKMQFKLYSTLYQKWVEQTADNKVKYVKNIDKATTFKTNSNGKLKITGLYAGESYSYELVEIGGKQPYYVQPLQVTQKTTPELRIVYGKTVYEGRKCYTFEGIKLPSEINTNTEVEIIDDATYGNLSVKKISKNNNERALRDVEIKIWSEERQAWLMTLDDGSYNYKEIYNDETGDMFSQYYTKDSNDSRTIFKTNKNGLINIKHIEKGEYKIYETKTFGIEYDITKQTGYDETLGMALLGTVSVDNETTDFEVEYEQIEREKGDLVLQKNGVYGINGEMITEKLENMSFKIYSNVEGDQKFGNWVVIKDDKELYPDGPIVDFVKDFDDATTFTTDENGQLTVKGLYLDFNNYVLVEVPTVVKEGDKQHTYYIDPIVISGDYNKNVGKMKVGENEYCAISNVKIEKDTSINIEINDNRTSGDLTVEKQDYTHNELKLAGAEFKIQIIKADYVDGVENMWLKALDNGSYDYSDYKHDEYLTSDENEAGVFKTGENGKFEVKSILNGTYQVYETKAPYGYDITKQDGYDPDKKWVVLGDHPTITTENNIVKYSFNNKKVVDSFEGDVWLDAEAQTKLGGRDDVYKEEQDKLLKEPITVNLRKIENDEIIATTQTVKEENGEYYKHYKFTKKDNGEDIIYWDLAEAYVEFIYNNKYIDDENYGYFTVEPFVGTDSKINSKAQEYTMTATRLDDDKLTGTTGEEPGRAVTNKDNKGLEVQDILSRNRKVEEKINNNNVSRDDLYNEPLTSYYDDTTYVIKDINLGLVEKYDPDYVTSET